MCLSHTSKRWISVLVSKWLVFQNTVTHIYIYITYISRLTVVSREAKEEVPCDGLLTNGREYFTRTNLDKIKNAPTDEP